MLSIQEIHLLILYKNSKSRVFGGQERDDYETHLDAVRLGLHDFFNAYWCDSGQATHSTGSGFPRLEKRAPKVSKLVLTMDERIMASTTMEAPHCHVCMRSQYLHDIGNILSRIESTIDLSRR